MKNIANIAEFDAKGAQLDMDSMSQKKLFIATPMYGGQCHGMFTKAIADLSAICAQYGIATRLYFLFNESLITRARNYCVDEFLRSDCTHLMFIDSDIGFHPNDVLLLLQLADTDKGGDIVCGPYPKKTIAWEKIKAAVDQGYAEENPFVLENFVGDYVFNLAGDEQQFKLRHPVQVLEGGTGFMMIPRKTFETYAEAYPEYKYLPDHNRTEHFDGSRQITAFFDTIIDPDSNRYLSEDYMFCQQAQKIGLKVWLCPWMQLRHVGSYTFGGSLGAMAAIQASPTSSKESNQKHYRQKDKRNSGKSRKGRK